jgi:sodium transport system ATP-binding protein
VIHISQLRRSYAGMSRPALDNISCSIKPGTATGLFGENGSGKTTLFRIVAGLLKPDSGSILVAGHDPQRKPRQVRASIGVLFGGDVQLYDRLTVTENILYFARLQQVPGHETFERLRTFAALLDMNTWLDKRAGALSRGMRQKTALVRALIHNPPLLLLDEPTTGLDLSAAGAFAGALDYCRQSGQTILISGHNREEICRSCERVLLLHNGRLAADLVLSGNLATDIDLLRDTYLAHRGGHHVS